MKRRDSLILFDGLSRSLGRLKFIGILLIMLKYFIVIIIIIFYSTRL